MSFAATRFDGDPDYEGALLRGMFVDTIAGLLQDLGVTQRELARRMGVTESRVSQILGRDENVTFETVARISAALGFRFELVPVERAGGVELPVWAHRLLHGRRAPRSGDEDDGLEPITLGPPG